MGEAAKSLPGFDRCKNCKEEVSLLEHSKIPHNWLITSRVANEFEKIHEPLHYALQIWLENA